MTTPATADWALPQPGGPDPGSDGLWRRIVAWWAEFSLQTKLLAIATLVVTFSAVIVYEWSDVVHPSR